MEDTSDNFNREELETFLEQFKPEIEGKSPDDKKKEEKDFEKIIKRIVRRSFIADEMHDQEKSLRELISAVKDREKNIDINSIVDSLTKSEFTIDPQIYEMVQEASNNLLKKYPGVKAVILMGSPIHGGAVVRRAMLPKDLIDHNVPIADLDWGIIVEEPLERGELSKLIKDMDKELRSIANLEELNSIKTCPVTNPIKNWVKNIQNVEEALALLEPNKIAESDNIFLYLEPSFPSKVNEQNRAYIFEALKIMYADESTRDDWRLTVISLLIQWEGIQYPQAIHHLKEKHLGQMPENESYSPQLEFASKDQTKRSEGLRLQASCISRRVMGNPLRKFLLSTKSLTQE